MRYLVVVQRDVPYEEVLNEEGCRQEGVDPEGTSHQEVSKVLACETTQEVAKAVRENPGWTLWEVTPRGIVQRAIVQKRDGGFCYDVEVS